MPPFPYFGVLLYILPSPAGESFSNRHECGPCCHLYIKLCGWYSTQENVIRV